MRSQRSLSKPSCDTLLALDALSDDNGVCRATNRELTVMANGLSISAMARRIATLHRRGMIEIDRSFAEDGRVGPRVITLTDKGQEVVREV